ncbi:hypothetical protein [Lysobacter sp. FW306-1B-D06B]|uniref:hypothetical protein n=1 Tax=Lysobacter sp. FW306-1B-D06B TaxID=3140250 RepID=UPI0031409761
MRNSDESYGMPRVRPRESLALTPVPLPMLQKILSWPAVLLAFAVAAIVGFMGYTEHSEMTRLADHGKQAIAQIEEVEWKTKRGMDRNFDLTITFDTEAGQNVKAKLRVDTDTGKRARDDDEFVELPIVYLPEKTSVVRQAGETNASMGMFVIAAIAALAGIVLLVLRLRSSKA